MAWRKIHWQKPGAPAGHTHCRRDLSRPTNQIRAWVREDPADPLINCKWCVAPAYTAANCRRVNAELDKARRNRFDPNKAKRPTGYGDR